VPYRIDVPDPPADALDRLIALGALDVELPPGGLAAILPDGVPADAVAAALGVDAVAVSPVTAVDDGSVWVLSRRPLHAGGVHIVPAGTATERGALQLIEGPAFGTGLHPTTALCLEALDAALDRGVPERVLDVGIGSGVLALGALLRGVSRAVGLDIDAAALRVAAENARVNQLADRLQLVQGGPEALLGTSPLVFANVLAAPLVDMAPVLVRRVAHGGRLILSGIPASMADELARVYVRLGMRRVYADARSGWSAVVLDPSW
jgi:ribosomal protein L11 methyltransferase